MVGGGGDRGAVWVDTGVLIAKLVAPQEYNKRMNEEAKRLLDNPLFKAQMAWVGVSPAQRGEWATRQRCEEEYAMLCWVLNSNETASVILQEIESEAAGDWNKVLIALQKKIDEARMG